MGPRLRQPGDQRWVAVAVTVAALIGLAQLSLAEPARPPRLGLQLAAEGERLVVVAVHPGGLAWDAGIRPGETVVAYDGRPVTAAVDLATVAAAAAVHTESAAGVVTIASVGAARSDSNQRRVSFLVLAACFIVVGSVVFVLTADRGAARVIFGGALAAAVTLVTAIGTPFGAPWALAVAYLGLVSGGAGIFLLFLVFPINRLRSRSGCRVMVLCLAGHAVLALSYGWVVVIAPPGYSVLQRLTLVVLLADMAAASVFAVLALLSTSPRQREARRALGFAALGTLVGLAPFCLFTLGPHLLGLGDLVSPEVAILGVGLLPVSLGGAVLSRQFLGITRIARRGLLALAVWIGLVGAYSLVLSTPWQRLAATDARFAAAAGATTLGVALTAGTFPAVQQWLHRTLERLLFHDVYDYAETLQDLSIEIARLAGVDTIVAHVLDRLGRTLDLSWAAIALQPDTAAAGLHHWGDCPADLDRLAAVNGAPAPGCARRSPTNPQLVQSVPLASEGVTIGTLLLGPKRHDIELLPEDDALVATLAPMMATALQNALLVQRQEAQAATLGDRERALAALNAKFIQVQEEERQRLALDLHDDPLQRAILLAREVGEGAECPDAQRWRRSVEEIISSLRAIGAGLRPPALDDFGLSVGLEQLVGELRARSDLAVDFVVRVADGAPFGRLESDLEVALYRVVQEALNNCLKHARATRVAIVLRRDGGKIGLSVVDDGQGIAPLANGDSATLHLGILGMRERLRPWAGVVKIGRSTQGGTHVVVEVTPRGRNEHAARSHVDSGGRC